MNVKMEILFVLLWGFSELIRSWWWKDGFFFNWKFMTNRLSSVCTSPHKSSSTFSPLPTRWWFSKWLNGKQNEWKWEGKKRKKSWKIKSDHICHEELFYVEIEVMNLFCVRVWRGFATERRHIERSSGVEWRSCRTSVKMLKCSHLKWCRFTL